MQRFRVIRGGLDKSAEPAAPGDPDNLRDTPLGPELRALYAPPSESYWDGFEARVMTAVRAGCAAPATAVSTAVDWWNTLANWARPGMAAAAVLIGIVGGVALQSRGARSDAAYRAVLQESGGSIEALDEALARASEAGYEKGVSAEARAQARAASELLSDGVKRRTGVRLDVDGQAPDSAKTPREATFRNVMP
jgi:hypothetical protein